MLGGDGDRTEQVTQPCGLLTGRERSIRYQETCLSTETFHKGMGCLHNKWVSPLPPLNAPLEGWEEGIPSLRRLPFSRCTIPGARRGWPGGRRRGVQIWGAGGWIVGRGPEALLPAQQVPSSQGMGMLSGAQPGRAPALSRLPPCLRQCPLPSLWT